MSSFAFSPAFNWMENQCIQNTQNMASNEGDSLFNIIHASTNGDFGYLMDKPCLIQRQSEVEDGQMTQMTASQTYFEGLCDPNVRINERSCTIDQEMPTNTLFLDAGDLHYSTIIDSHSGTCFSDMAMGSPASHDHSFPQIDEDRLTMVSLGRPEITFDSNFGDIFSY